MTTEGKIAKVLDDYFILDPQYYPVSKAIEDIQSIIREEKIKLLEEIDPIAYDQQYIFISRKLNELREDGKENGKV